MNYNFKKNNIFFVLFFLLILLLPLFDAVFNISPVKDLFEKRLPKQFPENPKNFQEIIEYPKKYEGFFDDNYGFRKSFIFLNSWLLDNIFNQSPNDRAIIGKDEWLFFDNLNSLLDAQDLAKTDDKKINYAIKVFIKNWQKLQEKNINYLVIIAADKTSIYPEFLPDFIKISEKNHRIDKFLEALRKENSNFPIIDLRPILLEAKQKEIIFHKTDTHWNRRGSHYAYVEIMKKFGLKYHPRLDFIDIEDKMYRGDISDIMNISQKNIDYDLKPKFVENFKQIKVDNLTKKEFHKPTFFVNQNKNLPILFVYKDSFFDNLFYFFAEHFSKSYFINESPCDLNFDVIKKYNPDFVIQEFWEARIEEIINKCE